MEHKWETNVCCCKSLRSGVCLVQQHHWLIQFHSSLSSTYSSRLIQQYNHTCCLQSSQARSISISQPLSVFLFPLAAPHGMWDLSSPNQRLNPYSLHQKAGFNHLDHWVSPLCVSFIISHLSRSPSRTNLTLEILPASSKSILPTTSFWMSWFEMICFFWIPRFMLPITLFVNNSSAINRASTTYQEITVSVCVSLYTRC